MRRLSMVFCVVLAAAVSNAATADSAPKEVERVLPNAQLLGETSTRYWGFKLYDAQLWTNGGNKFNPQGKFALTLRYAYSFSAELLARSSVEEIARVEGANPGTFGPLEQKLRGCMTDVNKGDRITGVAEAANRVSMFVNGRKSCTISYPRLRDRFFGIWLAPTSRDAKGARRLTGRS